jgi:uncharacterized protein (DUF58 family)
MKTLLANCTLVLWACQAALAQTQPAPVVTKVGVTQRRIGSDFPPAQRADEETTRLVGQLSLSPEQTTQVRAAALKKAQAHQAQLRKYEAMNFVGRVSPAEGQAIEAQFEAQLKAICTPEQYAKREKMQARFRQLRAQYDSLERVKQAAAGSPK